MNDFYVTLFAIERFITARWKALTPLVVYGVTYAIQNGFDVKQLASLTGIKEFVGIVVVAIAVHQTTNRPTT